MKEEDQILKTIQTFIENGLLTHDVDKTLSVISDTILGVGINEQGTVCSKAEIRRLLSALNDHSTGPCSITYPKSEIHYHPPGFATASVVYQLHFEENGLQMQSAFLQTAAAKKENGEWKLCLLQAVPVQLTEAGINNYPLKFADETLMQLRQELHGEIFQFLSGRLSVGILGAYIDGSDVPPFYINDNLLKMLDYTYEEFMSVMQHDSFAVVHPDDREHLQREMGAGIEKRQEYICQYRLIGKGGICRWVVEHGKPSCQDGRDIILSAFVDITETILLQEELKQKNNAILSSLEYAARIQKNLLPPEEDFNAVFPDFSVLWSPKDIVGGDMYWLKTFRQGTVVCVADCTGHGIPGALLAVLISTSLDSIVQEDNCRDTDHIICAMDRRGREILHSSQKSAQGVLDIRDGCDMAVLFISPDGDVTFSSAGIPIFMCDGSETKRFRGQALHIGEGSIKSPGQVKKTVIPAGGCTFYIASDGLFDQVGGPGSIPIGYHYFQDLISGLHGEKLSAVTQKVWEEFEAYRGHEKRRDDVELICFRP